MKSKKIDKAIDWYIKGEYHCDKCPFCWGGEYMPGCDDYDDCGCYIFGDLRDSCRLLPPIRFVLGWGKRKKACYCQAHEYDDIEEWYREKEKKEHQFKDIIKQEILDKYVLCFKDVDGNILTALDGNPAVDSSPDTWRLMNACEDMFSAPYMPLKTRWVHLIKDTWHALAMLFKPYFCK